MSATAFKNAVRRREHYERHQPAARERFGLLEKHKDYVKRSKNYHEKEKRIADLRKKAENRNPDEFYYKMLKSETKKGVHKGESERQALTADMLQLLKTQDKTYIQTQLNSEKQKAERLLSTLHNTKDAGRHNSHVKFEENREDDDDVLSAWDPLEDIEAPVAPSLKRKRLEEQPQDDVKDADLALDRKSRKKIEKAKRRSYAELEQRQERVKKLTTLAAHMDVTRALLQKGKRVKIADPDGDKPAVYMWKPQRKR